ncbi:hypothetical protein NG799_19725 [Laspinema sp. D1]|uniref:Uncharacterized protein n=1 Tax=Laspinema palackyanum D2a TaxID=2953684 RepID=A0ABT2MYH0_9CYAN|nr:hypothetical protein [Laspinema sp. D2a]
MLIKITKLIKILKVCWKAKKIWTKPNAAKVLIYDRVGSENFLQYLAENHVEILDIRGESINFYIILKLICDKKIINKHNYMDLYIKVIDPLIVMTFIDNSISFYKIQLKNPNAKKIFVQNGMRGELGDIFAYLQKNNSYHVDYMLTFSYPIGFKYQQYIQGEVMVIGGFKNNSFSKGKILSDKKSVLFISEYHPEPGLKNSPFWVEPDGRSVSWDDCFAAEFKLLPFLKNYCAKHNLILKIAARTHVIDGAEYQYFKKILGDKGWCYYPNCSPFSSYQLVESSEFIVSIDSTLGYEALARGKKTACFSIRSFSVYNRSTKFGWPAKLPEYGPFWTNHADDQEFERVINYVTTASDKEWQQTWQHYMADIMEYDPSNTRFRKLMCELGVPLKLEYTDVQ